MTRLFDIEPADFPAHMQPRLDAIAKAVAEYRAARAALDLAAQREDAAFVKWFNKVQAGEPTNAAAAQRLSNLTSYASADMSNAQSKLFALDIDPWDVDDADGHERTFVG